MQKKIIIGNKNIAKESQDSKVQKTQKRTVVAPVLEEYGNICVGKFPNFTHFLQFFKLT